MLRGPPSRIALTSTDIADFEHRFVVRQSSQLLNPQSANVRLSPGPSRRTSLAVISPEQNVGRQRAISSASQATLCSAENQPSGRHEPSLPAVPTSDWTASTPSNVRSQPPDQSQLFSEVARALENVARNVQRPEPSLSSLGLSSSPMVAAGITSSHDNPRRATGTSELYDRAYTDGCLDFPAPATPALQQGQSANQSLSYTGRPILGDIVFDAFPTTSPRHAVPDLLSSARARRRNARSHDISIAEDGEALQNLIQSRHVTRVPWRGLPPGAPPPVPELVLPHDEALSYNPAPLDAGAPVFVPRQRFGTVVGASSESENTAPEPRWSSLDSSHSNSDLRLRSSSEQNVDPTARQHAAAPAQRRDDAQPRHRRRSRASDQNDPVPNLERYPLLRPPPRQVPRRRNSGSQRPVHLPGRRVSRIGLNATQSTSHSHASILDVDNTPTSVIAPGSYDGAANSREALPAAQSISDSARSASTLHLPLSEPRIGARTSSLAWRDTSVSPTHRMPSMVTAASGVSTGLSSRHSSIEGLNAAAEFLRMRSSPLDELTERLSRLAANRPRSVGRSWERTPGQRPRVSLLNGDPFRQDSLPASPDENALRPTYDLAIAPATVPQPVELPASPAAQVAMAIIPSTPPVHTNAEPLSSPRRPLADMSPGKPQPTPGSAVRRKPVPTVTATPKVSVYNDAEPPTTQPQTPADLRRSSRHGRMRSDTVTSAPSSSAIDLSLVTLPQIPERHPHRHTYPSATPVQQSQAITTPYTAASPLDAVSQPRDHSRRQALTNRSTSEENDMENQFQQMEDDRRVWLDRREAGSLDSTPPAEGRYEHYLE